ncbi:hypothetical protein [Oleiharenicola sp. Vm1]|uniref:hypothetical protein n=1 Tax=Oleiharenicola sp. Vm1 TaxID=3398393 RepID=UPI0039F4EA22
MDTTAAESFLRFLREYGPTIRQTSMYHEEIDEFAAELKVTSLDFEHPAKIKLRQHFEPNEGRLSNLILTGTAGDGKSRILYEEWRALGGDEVFLVERREHGELTAPVDGKPRHFHFIFDLSKCIPDKGKAWRSDQIALLEAWSAALLGQNSTVFVVAANDGKLLQALRGLLAEQPSSPVGQIVKEVEDMLAAKRSTSSQLAVALLDLSSVSSAETLDRARAALLERPEWACFETASSDPAFGPDSPLRRNWEILHNPQFHRRLRALIQLCDVNGFHISVREIITLLVNALLGHPRAAERVMTVDEIRQFATPGEALRGSIYRNIFGENLKEERRQDFQVYGYLNYFRVGLETSNLIDELILFGRDLPALVSAYQRLVVDPTGRDGVSAVFESLRRDYLEAEDFDDSKREEFMGELAQQRRRLFFRIPDAESNAFDPWRLTVFQYAGRFIAKVLDPLRAGQAPDDATLETLVRGLNRVWSGMLFDEGNKLFLTSGLDFTSARISRLALHAVPISEDLSGDKVEIVLNDREQPELRVHLLGGAFVSYRLDLMRFEFLIRVAEGALPNSFSRECYEDVINFKGLLLGRVQAAMAKRDIRQFKYLTAGPSGQPVEQTINL